VTKCIETSKSRIPKAAQVKICTVPTDKAQELCPDPRIFNVCSTALSCCRSKEEIKKELEAWNKLCEENKCPYLIEPVK
jgi:hypothetical protein